MKKRKFLIYIVALVIISTQLIFAQERQQKRFRHGQQQSKTLTLKGKLEWQSCQEGGHSDTRNRKIR